MVKTRVISLLREEGRHERDQMAFCAFNSFSVLSAPQSPLCIAGRAGEREGKRKRGNVPRALSVFSILLGYPAGASAEERVLSGSLNECWPHTCDACVKTTWRFRIGGSYCRPELLFFWLLIDLTFATKSS